MPKVIEGNNDLYTWCKKNNGETILSEFDYAKNEPLTPSTVAFSSGKCLWWTCSSGHNWTAPVARRTTQHSTCPYCSGRLVIPGINDLQTLFPDVASEWHPTKNGSLTPRQVKGQSNKNVWWRDKYGHEWQAKINNRTSLNKRGCPICYGRKVLPGFNDLQFLFPDVAAEWDKEKNAPLLPSGVTPYSHKKVWWKCPVCNNSWQATISNRSKGTGCSRCQRHGTSKPEQGIAFYLNQVTSVQQRIRICNEEIDVYLPEYNIGIEYDGMYFHSSNYKILKDAKKRTVLASNNVTLLCIKEADRNELEGNTVLYTSDNMGPNYVWAIRKLFEMLSTITKNNMFKNIDVDIKRDYISIREKIDLFHKERSLAVVFPEIAKEWDYEKNGTLLPEQIYYGSTDIVFWKCSKCNNSWQESSANRTGHYKLGCPYCSNHKVITGQTDLATLNPALAAEWDYEKNKGLTNKKGQDMSTPDKVALTSNLRVWWKCTTCNNSWNAIICNRAKGRGCPACGLKKSHESLAKPKVGINDLASANPNLAKEWDYEKNAPLTPELVTVSANKKVYWKCSICDFSWAATINNRSQGKGCPNCGKKKTAASKYKPVICVETGKVYPSQVDAQKQTSIKSSLIGACCRGTQKTAGGFHWKFVNDM